VLQWWPSSLFPVQPPVLLSFPSTPWSACPSLHCMPRVVAFRQAGVCYELMWVSPPACRRFLLLLIHSPSSSRVCLPPPWQASVGSLSWDDQCHRIANISAASSCGSR
jgi:hypothetical protein